MRSLALVLALAVTGCSFIGVRGPNERVGRPPKRREDLNCTTSAALPGLDGLAGTAAIGAAGIGTLFEQVSEDGEPDGFTKYAAGPLFVGALVLFISASFGNTRVTWCSDAKDRAGGS
jgi:hypothetical protein